MKTTVFGWLALLLVPGCLLVQPLDAAKPEDDASAGSGNSSGKPSQAGSAGQHAGGNSAGGSENKAGSGPVPPGGAPSGGAPSGVDFSLFTGTWTITSGKDTVTCDGGTPQINDTTPGVTDDVGLGTTSDLIFDPGSDCEILADVTGHTASLNSDTTDCITSDSDYVYDLTFDSFEFVVSADEQTAKATVTSSVVVLDVNGQTTDCTSNHTWNYQR